VRRTVRQSVGFCYQQCAEYLLTRPQQCVEMLAMKLAEYCALHNLSVADLAKLLGVETHETVRLWIKGGRFPREGALKKIAEVTNGAVLPHDMITDRKPNGRKRKKNAKGRQP